MLFSFSTVLEKEAGRLLWANVAAPVLHPRRERQRYNKIGVAGAVQKGKISLIEMEVLAVEGMAWVQKEQFKSIKFFISFTVTPFQADKGKYIRIWELKKNSL